MAKREFSAGGIVIRGEGETLKVLLIKDGYGRWTWPKGNIDKGETSRKAALREIDEEVGLKDIKILNKITDIQYFYRFKGNLIFKNVTLFLLQSGSKDSLKIQKSEIQDAKWFHPEKALQKVEYKGSEKILQKAIAEYRKFIRK